MVFDNRLQSIFDADEEKENLDEVLEEREKEREGGAFEEQFRDRKGNEMGLGLSSTGVRG